MQMRQKTEEGLRIGARTARKDRGTASFLFLTMCSTCVREIAVCAHAKYEKYSSLLLPCKGGMSPKESPLEAFRAGGGSENRQCVCLFSGKRVRRRGKGMEFDPRYSSGYFSVQICTEKGVSLHPSLTPPLHHSPPKKIHGRGKKRGQDKQISVPFSTVCLTPILRTHVWMPKKEVGRPPRRPPQKTPPGPIQGR